MITVKIIDKEVVNKIESLSYEVEARKSVIAEMLAQNMDTGTEAFEKYQRELVKYKVEFETAKQELQEQYVDVVPNAQRWTLNYATCTLSITIADDKN